jgi:hypothetical protein
MDRDRDSINPKNVTDSFLSGATGKDDATKTRKVQAPKSASPTSQAAGILKGAESSASNSPMAAITGQGDAQSSESKGAGFMSNVAGGKKPGQPAALSGTGKVTGKFSLKKHGPIGFLIVLLLGGGGLVLGSQSMMPFAMVNNLMDDFNSMRTVMNRRTKAFFRYQIDNGRNAAVTKTSIFGNEKFKITNRIEKKLAKSGIETAKDSKGKVLGLVFEESPGVKSLVTVNGAMPSTTSIELSSNTQLNGKVMSLEAAYGVETFSVNFDKGTRTMKGHIVGWFDSVVSKVLNRLSIGRNKYRNYSASSDKESLNAIDKQKMKEGMQLQEADIEEKEVEKDGVKTKEKTTTNTSTDIPDIDPPEERAAKLKARSKAKYDAATKATGIASAAVGLTCAAMTGIGIVLAALAAYNAMQVLNYISGFLESVQKVQAGSGSNSPMQEYSNNLTKVDANGKSAMASAGVAALFDGSPVDKNNEGVKSFNVESSVSGFLGALGASIASFMICSIAKAAAAAVGFVIDFIGIFTFGALNLAELGATAAISAVAGLAFPEILEKISGLIINVFGRQLLASAVGEDVGNAIMSGANMYMGKNHQGGGGSLGTKSQVVAYYKETQSVIAEEADFDRKTRSPFDITSQNTFLGSILYKLMPISADASASSLMSGVSTTVVNSITAISPTAQAAGEASFVSSINTECPYLSGIGAVGDAFCNPYYISDLSTIADDPADVFNKVDQKGNFNGYDEQTGNPKIALATGISGEDHPMTGLAKYILACGTRDSTFGTADANIAGQINTVSTYTSFNTENNHVNAVGNAVTGSIPMLSDAQQIAEEVNNQTNIGWIGGQSCVANSADNSWNSETKYYQRYVEDQRLMENEGLVAKSSVTAFLEEYYEQFPLDDSEAGILARFMGSTKEDAEYAIAQLERVEFLETYEPFAYGPVYMYQEALLSEAFGGLIIANHDQRTGSVISLTMPPSLRNRTTTV